MSLEHLRSSNLVRLSLALLAVVIALITLVTFFSMQLRESIIDLRREELKRLVSLGRGSIEPALEQFRSGELDREETLIEVRNRLRKLTYQDPFTENYLFMSSYDGTMLVQPFEPEREGSSQWDLQDSNGLYIIRELVKTAQTGSGFVEYYYPPPDREEPELKISYVVGIDELDAYVGTGMYVGDIILWIHSLYNRVIGVVSLVFFLLCIILLYFFSPFYRVYRYLLDQFSLVREDPERDHQRVAPPKIRNREARRLIGDYERMMQEIRLSRKRLEASLEEKRTLLKEVHHRVKNNLQIISSLLSLQSSYIDEEALLSTFEESILRIHSMAHIHETIYATGSFQAIRMQGYIQSVVDAVHQSMAAPGFRLDLSYDLDEGELDIDKAILCGLILTEMVTNCYKHAFSGRQEGSLSVRYRNEADTAILTVADDGTGVEGDLLEQEFGSLGITLIKSLSAQLEGSLSFRLNGGSEFSLRIPR